MNEVGAVVRRMARIILEHDALEISKAPAEIGVLFQGRDSFKRAKTALEKGDGIGQPLIRRYLGHGDERLCARTVEEINEGIAAIKQAGIYAKLITR